MFISPNRFLSGKYHLDDFPDFFTRFRVIMDVVTDFSSPGLISILRSALERLGDESTGGSDDPAVLKFKQRILRSIAQLELTRNSLKAPDVVSSEQPAPARISPVSDRDMPSEASLSPDSVIVLVARRSRKSSGNDSGGGHSSAA